MTRGKFGPIVDDSFTSDPEALNDAIFISTDDDTEEIKRKRRLQHNLRKKKRAGIQPFGGFPKVTTATTIGRGGWGAAHGREDNNNDNIAKLYGFREGEDNSHVIERLNREEAFEEIRDRNIKRVIDGVGERRRAIKETRMKMRMNPPPLSTSQKAAFSDDPRHWHRGWEFNNDEANPSESEAWEMQGSYSRWENDKELNRAIDLEEGGTVYDQRLKQQQQQQQQQRNDCRTETSGRGDDNAGNNNDKGRGDNGSSGYRYQSSRLVNTTRYRKKEPNFEDFPLELGYWWGKEHVGSKEELIRNGYILGENQLEEEGHAARGGKTALELAGWQRKSWEEFQQERKAVAKRAKEIRDLIDHGIQDPRDKELDEIEARELREELIRLKIPVSSPHEWFRRNETHTTMKTTYTTAHAQSERSVDSHRYDRDDIEPLKNYTSRRYHEALHPNNPRRQQRYWGRRGPEPWNVDLLKRGSPLESRFAHHLEENIDDTREPQI
eukprot:jgi/Bigna1/137896/aug1.41_g12604